MLTKARIGEIAGACQFKVLDVEPSGIGAQVHISVKDERTDTKAVLAIWPESTEDDLLYLIVRAAFEVRGPGPIAPGGHEWMM